MKTSVRTLRDHIVFRLMVAGILLLLTAQAARAEIALIAHPDTPVASVTAQDAQKIFLGKSRSLPGAGTVTPVDQEDGSRAKDEFYDKVVQKNSVQLKAYWSKLIFSGRGTPPAVVGGDAAVKQWVATHPGSLGYVDSAHVDSSVKVLLTIP